ncbi:hypothetical protein G6F56_012798 [Rhizopus delemar]|nr:hypothetical protein G6F56_012798 [Rhizopus delemar]
MSMSSTESVADMKEEAHVVMETKKNRKKQYCCDQCHKIFNRPSALKTHMYTHTGEKPYSCSSQGCNRQFSVISNLRRHLKVHRKPANRNKISPEERERQMRILINKRSEELPLLNAYPGSHCFNISTVRYNPNLQEDYNQMFRSNLYAMDNVIDYTSSFTDSSFTDLSFADSSLWSTISPLTRDISYTFYP